MSIFADYTDGIPVKISERFKKPPRIELGRSEVECETRGRRALGTCCYGFSFEGRVLSKVAELRAAKETLRSERRHRLRLLEEAKQRCLDKVAAAEDEERLGQLSVSQVSYPSVDDFSDARVEVGAESDADVESGLLRPVRVHAALAASHLLDDPDPLLELRRRAAASAAHRAAYARVPRLASLTVSDFENDTSSPFDDAELESIDDIAQLEQILREQAPPAPPLQAVSYLDDRIVCDIPGYGYSTPSAAAYSTYATPLHLYSTGAPPPAPASRSRCVPDIVRELSEELACERLRVQHLSPAAPAQLDSHLVAPAPPPPAPPPPAADALPDVYDELPAHLQEMCRNIENMGFPRGRVARVCSLLGDSHKKVIEGVLLVGQLLDLGFSEGRVAAALAKHHFNRDKALDDLIA